MFVIFQQVQNSHVYNISRSKVMFFFIFQLGLFKVMCL